MNQISTEILSWRYLAGIKLTKNWLKEKKTFCLTIQNKINSVSFTKFMESIFRQLQELQDWNYNIKNTDTVNLPWYTSWWNTGCAFYIVNKKGFNRYKRKLWITEWDKNTACARNRNRVPGVMSHSLRMSDMLFHDTICILYLWMSKMNQSNLKGSLVSPIIGMTSTH